MKIPLRLQVFLFFIVTLGTFIFFNERGIRAYTEKNSQQSSWSQKNNSLYLLSPFELSMLKNNQKLWPELFHSKNYPQARNIHRLYTNLLRKKILPQSETKVVERYRRWSFLMNKSDRGVFLENFHASAVEEPEKLSFDELFENGAHDRETKKCSLFAQERVYRMAQIYPRFQSESYGRLQECKADALVLDSLALLKAIDDEDLKKIHVLHSKLAKDSTDEDKLSDTDFKYFYTQFLWNVADYSLLTLSP